MGLDAIYPLHPHWMTPVIAGVLPAAWLIQWLVSLDLARRKGVMREIPRKYRRVERPAMTLSDVPRRVLHGARNMFAEEKEPWLIESEQRDKLVPFMHDHFYIAWNILPMALLAFYWWIWFEWDAWSDTIYHHFDSPTAGFLDWCVWVPDHPVVLALIFGIAVVSAVAQEGKQSKFRTARAGERFMYWWDIDISRRIFRIREVGLVFNFFAVEWVFLKLLGLSAYICALPFYSGVHATLGHPDGYGGLKPLGLLCLTLGLAWIVTFAIGFLGAVDHSGQGALHKLGDFVLVTVPSVFAGLVLLMPAVKVHSVVLEEQLLPAREAFGTLAAECVELVVGGASDCPYVDLEGVGQSVLQTRAGLGVLDFELILLVFTFLAPILLRYRSSLSELIRARFGESDRRREGAGPASPLAPELSSSEAFIWRRRRGSRRKPRRSRRRRSSRRDLRR